MSLNCFFDFKNSYHPISVPHFLRICGGDPNFSILEVESTEDLCLTRQTGERLLLCTHIASEVAVISCVVIICDLLVQSAVFRHLNRLLYVIILLAKTYCT